MKKETLPNPTLIDSPGGKKTVVFTAYLQESMHSREYKKEDYREKNTVRGGNYPTVFFYDPQKERTVWEIFGAEQFICAFSSKKTVLVYNCEENAI